MNLTLPDCFLADLAALFGFGILAIGILIIGYKAFDKATPKLHFDEEIMKGNLAMAIVVGSFLIGICMVIGKAIAAIIGAAA